MFNERSKALETAYDENIDALTNLLELGVVSETEYALRVGQYTADLKSQHSALEAERDREIAAIQALSDALEDGTIDVDQALQELTEHLKALGFADEDLPGEVAGSDTEAADEATDEAVGDEGDDEVGHYIVLPGGKKLYVYASGSADLDEDQIAKVHQGEMIVPRTFADSIRSGDLALSGRKVGGSTTIYEIYEVNVEGSVMAEDDLAVKIARAIKRKTTRGQGDDDLGN